MKTTLAAIIITGIAGVCGGAELPLQQAQKLLFDRNPDLAIAQGQVDLAKLRLGGAWSTWQPSVSAAASYLYQSKTQSGEIRDVPFLPPGTVIPLSLGGHDRTEFGIDAVYPLFTGFSRYFAVKTGRCDVDIAQEQRRAAANALSFQLGITYFAWEQSLAGVAARESLLKQLTEYARQTDDQYAAGTATSARVSEARARVAQVSADVLAARASADSLKLEIANLVLADDTAFSPVPYAFNADSAMTLDLNRGRPELRLLDDTENKLAMQRTALLGRRLPALTAVAGLRYANPGLNMTADEFMNYGILGVSASWNIYDGRKSYFQRREVSETIEQVRNQRRKSFAQWDNALAHARLQLAQSKEFERAAAASLDASKVSARDLEAAMQAGTATSADYLNALTAVAQAEFFVEQARFRAKAAYLSLLFAAGKEIAF
jgi:outer membrane protein TolC